MVITIYGPGLKTKKNIKSILNQEAREQEIVQKYMRGNFIIIQDHFPQQKFRYYENLEL